MELLKNNFNAIIEGAYHEDWIRFYYVSTILKIPKNAVILYDGEYAYKLFGRTRDFRELERDLGQKGGLVSHISRSHSMMLERPRSIYLRDGRVYVEEKMIEDESYVKSVNSLILGRVGDMFRS